MCVESRFVAHVTFPAGKTAFPGHAQWHMLRCPREGVEQREERCAKPSFSNWESVHFGRHGLRVDASFWKADAFPPRIRTLSIMLCPFVLLAYLVYSTGGDTRGETWQVTGAAVLYTEGPPRSTGAVSPAVPPSRQLESKDGGSNAKGACKPCCFCWKTGTFRNAPLQRKLQLLLIVTFPIGKVMFLHVAPDAPQARGMSGWRRHVADGK